MSDKKLGMNETEMGDDAPTVSLKDEEGRSLLCYVERTLSLDGDSYLLLFPVDAPIEILAWAEDDDHDDEEMLIGIDDEELDDIFSTARAVLAEQDLILQRTALTLTASGELPDVDEESIITLDVEQEDGQVSIEQFQELASFFHEEQEYVICTPLDSYPFFARVNAADEPELLTEQDLGNLLKLDEFKSLLAELERESDESEED